MEEGTPESRRQQCSGTILTPTVRSVVVQEFPCFHHPINLQLLPLPPRCFSVQRLTCLGTVHLEEGSSLRCLTTASRPRRPSHSPSLKSKRCLSIPMTGIY